MNKDVTAPPVFAPRLDLWYIAQRARGTLLPGLDGMTTVELADSLGLACHAVRADYTVSRDATELALRGIGFDNHPDYPFRVEVRGLDVRFESDGETSTTTVETSSGPISWQLQYTTDMAGAGVSLPFVRSYPVKTDDDLDRLAELFDHLAVVPTPLAYDAFHARIGDRGVAVANGCIVASPMHLLLHDLMPIDRFFYAYHDNYDSLASFAARAEPVFREMLDASARCSAEVVLWGGNYDRDVTWPPFFDSEIAPAIEAAGERLRSAGKLLLCHTDGENEGLFAGYRSAGFDVAESVCPAPMTSSTLRALRTEFGAGVCMWGGVPSVVLLRDSFGDADFASWLQDLQVEIRRADRRLSPLILGVSDNVPPDADLNRLQAIAAMVRGG